MAAFCQPVENGGGISRNELEDLQENWKEKGFVSEDMAKSVCLMANPGTTKRTRELEVANMKSKIIRAAANKRRREQDKVELRSLRSH